jgi:hypothetical protein
MPTPLLQDATFDIDYEIDDTPTGDTEPVGATERVGDTGPAGDTEPTCTDAATPAKERKPSQASLLVQLALDRYELGRTPKDKAFAYPKHGPNIVRMLDGAQSVRCELMAAFFEKYGTVPSASAAGDALAVLKGRALQTEPTEPALRLAPWQNRVVIDLGDATGRAVVVDASGWRVVDSSPVLFRRTALTDALPVPVPGGDLENLRQLLNVADGSWGVLRGYLVSCLIPKMSHPVCLLTGEQGTGKTMAAEMLVGLIDPATAPTRSAPRTEQDWVVAGAGSWMVAIDNISYIQQWFSDAICKACTGSGMVQRTLYTDDDISVLRFHGCVMLTSIDAGALRGDLADRLVTLELERIPPAARLLESALKTNYEQQRPRLFGALLDLLVQVLGELPNVQLDEFPRMADFARVLGALDLALGTNSLDTYLGQARTTAATVVEGDPVAHEVMRFVQRRPDGWTGTASQLLELLERPEALDRRRWPADGARLSGRLKETAPALNKLGVDVRWLPRTRGQRPLRVERTSDWNDSAMSASPGDETAVVENFPHDNEPF